MVSTWKPNKVAWMWIRPIEWGYICIQIYGKIQSMESEKSTMWTFFRLEKVYSWSQVKIRPRELPYPCVGDLVSLKTLM